MAVDFLPHPITTQGRRFIPAKPGTTLEQVFQKEIFDGPVVAVLDGERIYREDWHKIQIERDSVIQVRALVEGGGDGGSNPIAVVLGLAAVFAAPYFALNVLKLTAGTALAKGVTAAVGAAGLLLANYLFPPRLPKTRADEENARQYTLQAGSNRARPNEPLLLVLGKHRTFPDLASRPYTEFGSHEPATFQIPTDSESRGTIFDPSTFATYEGSQFGEGERRNDTHVDQYLNSLFDFGIGNLKIENVRLGETSIGDYSDVWVQTEPPITLFAGNVDTLDGGGLRDTNEENPDVPHPILKRTTKGDTIRIVIDFVAIYIRSDSDGDITGLPMEFRVRHRLKGTAAWTTQQLRLQSPNGADGRQLLRRSHSIDVVSGEHDVEVQLTTRFDPKADDRARLEASVVQIKAYQPQGATFDGRNPYAMRIRATAQLQGTIERLSADVSQLVSVYDPVNEVWNDDQETGNPAWTLLQYLRGWRDSTGRLIAGMGIPDDRIDVERIIEWGAFCDAEGLECNTVIDRARTDRDILELITKCGWGSMDLSTGKWGVLWENDDQPVSAIFTPSNIVAGSLSIGYNNRGLADEIVGNYFDREQNYEQNHVDRTVPGVGTPENSVTIPLEGITVGEQAAKEINRTAAAQHYHTRSISWETSEEGFFVTRGDVVGLSHNLIGGSVGGRLLAVSEDRDAIVPTKMPANDGEVWIWLLNGKVHLSDYTLGGGEMALATPIPEEGYPKDEPLAYKYMAFEPTQKPAQVRITGIEPTTAGQYKIIARDEVEEYYAFRTSNLDVPLIPVRQTNIVVRGITIQDTIEDGLGGQQVFLNIAVQQTGDDAPSVIRVDGEVVGTVPFGETIKFAIGKKTGTVKVSATPGTIENPLGRTFSTSYTILGKSYAPLKVADYRVTDNQGVRSHTFTPATDESVAGYMIRYQATATLVDVATHQDNWNDLTPVNSTAITTVPFESIAPVVSERGNYLFAVRAVDTEGNLGEASYFALELGPFTVEGEELETIYAATAGSTIASNQRPSNAWKYGQPTSANGVTWERTFSSISQTRPYLWSSSRIVPENAEVGDAVSEQWTAPVLIAHYGVDGFGLEYIYTVTSSPNVALSQRPSNAWGFDDPKTINGLRWYDEPPDILSSSRPYLWQCLRRVTGQPNKGDAVSYNWNMPKIISRFGSDGTNGRDGLDGIAGANGDDGNGVEYVFATTAGSVARIAGSQLPSNAWGFDSVPRTIGGLTWNDGAPNLTKEKPLLWRSQRRAPGNPPVNTPIADTWSSPTIVGRYGDDGQPGLDGVPGSDGDDGNGVEYVFARTRGSQGSIPGSQRPSNTWGFDDPKTIGGLQWNDGAPFLNADFPILWSCQRRAPGSPPRGTAVSDTWSDPVIVGRYGTDGQAGLDGIDGSNGDDGNGIEYVFSTTNSNTLPSSQRPSNSWGFDVAPKTIGGLTWHDGAPNLSPTRAFLWRSQRKAPGQPARGTAISDTWSIPAIVGHYGIDGVSTTQARGPAFEIVNLGNVNISVVSGSSLTTTYINRANAATPGDNVVGDFVTFISTSTTLGGAVAWTWSGTRWVKAPRFIGAQHIAAIDFTALTGRITGKLSAGSIDSDVINVKVLSTGTSTIGTSNALVSAPSWSNYDELIFHTSRVASGYTFYGVIVVSTAEIGGSTRAFSGLSGETSLTCTITSAGVSALNVSVPSQLPGSQPTGWRITRVVGLKGTA